MTPEQIAELVKRSLTESLTVALAAQLPDAVRSAVDPVIAPLKTELAETKAAVAELRAKVDAQRAQTPIAPEKRTPDATLDGKGNMESDELKLVKDELATLRAQFAAAMEAPQRRGVHIEGRVPVVTAGPGADAGFRSLVGACRDRKHGTALAAVVERHIDVIAEADGPASVNGKGSVQNLTSILAAGLRAAELDGLINSTSGASWA